MSRDKSVTFALRRLWEAGKPAKGTQRGELLAPSRQELMHIGLMPDIEQKPILRGVEHTFNGDRQLYDAEVGGKMTACFGDIQHQKLPNFIAQESKLLHIQAADILGGMNLIQ